MKIQLLLPVDNGAETILAGAVIDVEDLDTVLQVIRQMIGAAVDPGAVMDEMIRRAIDEIQAIGRWNVTADLRRQEDLVDECYKAVLAGTISLDSFLHAVERWKAVGTDDVILRNPYQQGSRAAREWSWQMIQEAKLRWKCLSGNTKAKK